MSARLLLTNRLSSRNIRTLIATLLITSVLAAAAYAAPTVDLLEVHFIDVGQGDSILVVAPDGQTMLVDAGDRRAGPVVVGYLRALGITELNVLVSTHPHSDHIGGMAQVLAAFKVDHIYDSGRLHTSRTYEDYLKLIDAKNIPFALARAGDTIPLGKGVSVTVLWPEGPRGILDYRDLNESSVVIRVSYGKVDYLLTGDAGIATEKTMLAMGHLGPVEILKVGHHGSRSGTSAELIRVIQPQVAVIMCAVDNPYGHPHQQVTDRLTQAKAKILRTDLAGTIVISTDGESYLVGGVSEAAATLESELPEPQGQLININTASVQELQRLPGIGETLARRIIEYRIEIGLITCAQDLLAVKGIGTATLDKIQDLITY